MAAPTGHSATGYAARLNRETSVAFFRSTKAANIIKVRVFRAHKNQRTMGKSNKPHAALKDQENSLNILLRRKRI